MSTEKIVRTVAGRLSLREPQTVSLERLHTALDARHEASLGHGVN